MAGRKKKSNNGNSIKMLSVYINQNENEKKVKFQKNVLFVSGELFLGSNISWRRDTRDCYFSLT